MKNLDRLNYAFEVKLLESEAIVGTFSGYGSVFGNTDSHGDVVAKGAFKETLKQWGKKKKLPKMLLQHGGGFFGGSGLDAISVGQWTSMEEDGIGLRCEGKLFALDTDRGKLIYEAVKTGELDGLSIGFRTLREDVVYGDGKDTAARTIKKLELFEVSLVMFGSNGLALVDTTKSEQIDEIESLADAENFLREAGQLDRKSATAFVSRLKRLVQREAAASGEEALADLIRRNIETLRA